MLFRSRQLIEAKNWERLYRAVSSTFFSRDTRRLMCNFLVWMLPSPNLRPSSVEFGLNYCHVIAAAVHRYIVMPSRHISHSCICAAPQPGYWRAPLPRYGLGTFPKLQPLLLLRLRSQLVHAGSRHPHSHPHYPNPHATYGSRQHEARQVSTQSLLPSPYSVCVLSFHRKRTP